MCNGSIMAFIKLIKENKEVLEAYNNLKKELVTKKLSESDFADKLIEITKKYNIEMTKEEILAELKKEAEQEVQEKELDNVAGGICDDKFTGNQYSCKHIDVKSGKIKHNRQKHDDNCGYCNSQKYKIKDCLGL